MATDSAVPARQQETTPTAVTETRSNDHRQVGWRALAAVGSGLAQLVALPPYGLWLLAPLSAALLLLAVRGTRPRRAAWLGALAGATLMVPLVRWQDVFGVDVWLVIAAAETVYFVPMAMGIAVVARLRGWMVWTSALWVAQELVRARWPFGGFPWGKLAFAQPDTPFAGYAAWGSSALVTFMVALAGALLVAAALRVYRDLATPRAWLAPVAACAAGVVAILAVGAVAPRVGAPEAEDTLTVGLVQGNVPNVGEMSISGERQAILNNHVEATHELAAEVRDGTFPQPDLVVLPENASDIDPFRDADAYDLIQGAADDVDAPLMFGISRYLDDGRREVGSQAWEPQAGPGDFYQKRYLVPFGEYIPYRDFFSRLDSRLDQITSDAIPGTDPGAIDVDGTTVATAICFDIAFDRPVREAVVAGGQILAVPTNNANYNFTGQSYQQLAITQLRAVEHGRPAIVAATSGVSAVVQPDGSLDYTSPEAERAIHVAEVPSMSGLTPAARLGSTPEWALALLGLGAVVTAVVMARRARTAG